MVLMLKELKKRNSCVNRLEDPPALVEFDGTALKTDGIFCVYDAVSGYCYTNAIHFDGTGLKVIKEQVPAGLTCSGINACDYVAGTGLKVVSYSPTGC